MSKGCIILKKGLKPNELNVKNGEIEDAFSEPLSLCCSPPSAYIEFVQAKKIVKHLSVVVTTNEFQNGCIFLFKILCGGNTKRSKMRGLPSQRNAV